MPRFRETMESAPSTFRIESAVFPALHRRISLSFQETSFRIKISHRGRNEIKTAALKPYLSRVFGLPIYFSYVRAL